MNKPFSWLPSPNQVVVPLTAQEFYAFWINKINAPRDLPKKVYVSQRWIDQVVAAGLKDQIPWDQIIIAEPVAENK